MVPLMSVQMTPQMDQLANSFQGGLQLGQQQQQQQATHAHKPCPKDKATYLKELLADKIRISQLPNMFIHVMDFKLKILDKKQSFLKIILHKIQCRFQISALKISKIHEKLRKCWTMRLHELGLYCLRQVKAPLCASQTRLARMWY